MNTQAFDKLLPVDKRKGANGKGWADGKGKGRREDNEQMEMEQKRVEGKRRKW